MPRTAVLIPCHNEEMTVAKVISDFRAQLPDARIYVCDNNSSDRTAAVAAEAGAIVITEKNSGKGNAVRKLFESVDADVYVLVDGDDTYDATDSPAMVQNIVDGCDMVVADRLSSTYFNVNKRPLHNCGNRLVRFFVNLIFRSDIKDIMSGYRAFSNRFVKNFPISSAGFEIETEMTIHALNYKFNVAQFASEYRDRPPMSKSKLNTYSDGVKVIGTIFRLFRDYRPMMMCSLFALIILLIAVGLFIPVFVEYLSTGLVPRFPTLIVSGFLTMMAMLLICVGFVLNGQAVKQRFLYRVMVMNSGNNSKTHRL